MEVYILTKYNPDTEECVIVKVFDELWKATEYVYCFSASHYGREGVSYIETLDYCSYTVKTKTGGHVNFTCSVFEVE